MQKIQTQGVHHITLIGADRQTSIDFWEGVLGMPFIFEQPNLDVPAESHLYFDPGDGRLITIFTREDRKPDPTPNPEGIGNLHHIAFNVSPRSIPRLRRGWMRAASSIRPKSTAASWIPSTSATRWANSMNWPPTSLNRRWGSPMPRCCWKRTNCAWPRATTTSPTHTWPTLSSN